MTGIAQFAFGNHDAPRCRSQGAYLHDLSEHVLVLMILASYWVRLLCVYRLGSNRVASFVQVSKEAVLIYGLIWTPIP